MSRFAVYPVLATTTILFIVCPGVIGCYSSVSSFGTTYPVGDISRRAGSDLVINCTLNANYTGPSNSSDIGWYFEDKRVLTTFVTVIDSRTAQLRLPNLITSNSGKYNCILRSSRTSLCLNVVTVGEPPPKIDEGNFRCRSERWRNLTCRWDVPDNPTPTTWTLYYRLPQGNASCPVHLWNRGAHQCFFNESTYPGYRQAAPFFYFVLTGNNTYGTSLSQFKVDHFKNVVPSPPKEFTVMPYGNTGLRMSWTMESLFKIFPVPLVFRLRFRSQWDPSDVFQKVEVTNRTLYILDELVPYTQYELVIQCRSELAADNETMWSAELRKEFGTRAEVPSAPLETVTGGFDDVNVDMDRRNITIYWKSLPEMLHYGPNFTYTIRVHENNVEANFRPTLYTDLYAKFYALQKSRSYTFRIRASNAAGVSNVVGAIFVDKSTNKPNLPEGFSVIYYDRGIYELSWHRPRRGADQIVDYTAFWCKSHRQMLDPCNASIEWQRVDASGGVHVVNVTVSDSSNNYRFALSANGKSASSGMVWSKCMALFNGVLGKIKMLPLKVVGPDKIEINWVVDCLDRTGRIVGFNISYCIFDNHNNSCKDGHPDYEFVPDCTKTSHVLSNLRPFTMYSVSVAAKTKSADGEPCDAQQAITWEGAPGSPPQDVRVVSVTNHSITVEWKPPSDPNGIITYYVIEYGDEKERVDVTENNSVVALDHILTTITDKVFSYTNYTIRVTACTIKGCSNRSSPVVVTTDIGVPGQPDPPKVRLLNATHAIVSWDYPSDVGGPIDIWRLLVAWKTSNVPGGNMTLNVKNVKTWIVPVRCDGTISEDTEYLFAISAVNVKNGEMLAGNWSDFSAVNACFTETWMGMSNGEIAGVVIGGALGLSLLILCFFFVVRLVRSRVHQGQKMKVDLPKGLIEGSDCGYGDFKRNLSAITESSNIQPTISSVRLYGRLQSISSDEGRSSQDSGNTLNMTSSLNSINDEMLYLEKGVHDSLNKLSYGRLPSSDSSGCSSVGSSISSSASTRTHLSSDSCTEADLMVQLPLSPDMVFFDSLVAAGAPATSNWMEPNSTTATTSLSSQPPPPAPNCQLRLRSTVINIQPVDIQESDCEQVVSGVSETTTTSSDDKPVGGVPTSKPLTSSQDPTGAHYSRLTKNRLNVLPDERSKPPTSNSEVVDVAPPYSRVADHVQVPRPKLVQGYVCIGAADNVNVDMSKATVDAADTIPKARKYRKISLPMGVVTKISQPNCDSIGVGGVDAVGSYVTVASMEEKPRDDVDATAVTQKTTTTTTTNVPGYSKLASAGVNVASQEVEGCASIPLKSLLNLVPDDYRNNCVLSDAEDYDSVEFSDSNASASTQDVVIGKKNGYVTAVSLDEHAAVPSVVPTTDLTLSVADPSGGGGGSGDGSSWEKDLEDSEENVTEEDIMSVGPTSSSYVTVSGGIVT